MDPFRISRASGQPPAGVDGAGTRDGLALGSSIHGVFNSYSLRGVILEHLAEWKGASLPDPSNTGGHLRRHGIPGVRSAHRASHGGHAAPGQGDEFGIIYGLPAHGMSQETNLDLRESAAFIESYFAKYPGIRFSIEEAKQQARERRYSETILGRQRFSPEINHSNIHTRQAAERIAINMPIQGTAADIIKIAMIRIHNRMKENELDGRMLLQVHDELIFEAPPREIATMEDMILELMPSALELSVPLKVDLKIGPTWGDLE